MTKDGGHVILIIRNPPIFIAANVARGLSFRKGETVIISVIVQTYQGKKELVVHSPNGIRMKAQGESG